MGDMLSQAEINALLGGIAPEETDVAADEAAAVAILTDEERDILGEIGNISMGTSATTLFALLREKVLITTPRVSVTRWDELARGYDRPCVGVRVDYKDGVEGANVMLLRDKDVKIIADLMMGGDGSEDTNRELNDMDLSAIAEAMNQMVGSAATSLASLVKMRIDIHTPVAFVLNFTDNSFYDEISFAPDEVVCIAFKMEIGTLIDSEIMQILPMKLAKDLVDIMKGEIQPKMAAPPPPPQKSIPEKQRVSAAVPPPPPKTYYTPPQNINVQSAQFQNFDVFPETQQKENINIIMDVPLEVTVELGRTNKKIKEILEFSPGTIIELDKLAGEPIDILVNGKFVAKGEVVVIDENFGIRVSEIINAEQRL